jgi:DNA-binding transcriptional MerR regulator
MEKDLLRLQQVLALRYLGFSLKQIGRLLERPDFDIAASLKAQRNVLQERISNLQNMSTTLERLLDRLADNGRLEPQLVARATQETSRALAQGGSKMNEQEMLKRFEELGQQLGPGEREQFETGWAELITEIEANLHVDPASPEAGELAERWNALRLKMSDAYNNRGFGDLWEAVAEKYRDRAYTDARAPSPEVREFISKAIAAHR